MSIIVTSLPAYVNQDRDRLLRAAILGSKSAKMFSLQTGVKKSASLNLLATDLVLQDGSDCGWDDAGSSTVSQRIITAPLTKVNMSFCDKTLVGKALEHEVRIAAGQKKLPFEQDFLGGVLENVDNAVERIVWQGDTASADTTLKRSDGLIKILVADVPAGNKVDLAAFDLATPAGVKSAVDAVMTAIPVEIMQNAKIFLGYDLYKLYIMQLQVLNLYHNAGDGLSNDSITYQGSNITVEAVGGLNGTGKIVAANPENFHYGTDLMNDHEKFEFWYSQDNREFRLAIEFNMGVQVAYPSQVIYAADLT